MKYSVVIPCYNVQDYVEVCLQSVIRASKAVSGQVEIIVVNDASTDDTRQKVEQIAHDLAQDIPIVNINNSENRGLAATRNIAVSHSRGSYVLLLDGDNLVHDRIFEILERETVAHPDVDIFVLGMALIDTRGNVVGNFYGDKIRADVAADMGAMSIPLLRGNFIDNFSLVRRDVLGERPYNEHLRALEDWDLWIRLSWIGRCRFGFIPFPMGGYRLREESLTWEMERDPKFRERVMLKIYSKILLNSKAMALPAELYAQITMLIRQLCANLILS